MGVVSIPNSVGDEGKEHAFFPGAFLRALYGFVVFSREGMLRLGT